MPSAVCLAGLLILLSQVPPPAPSQTTDVTGELEVARLEIVAHEVSELKQLADELDRAKNTLAAREVRARLGPPSLANGPTRFVPFPEVVPPGTSIEGVDRSSASPPGPWRAKLALIWSHAGNDLFRLAERAASSAPPRFALASALLRETLKRQPDHREARRLLGYVPHEGGWSKVFAVRQRRQGFVNHPIFGWVPSDWAAHLDRGELPAPTSRVQKLTRWLPAAEADRLRSGWDPPWRISTEHFEIQTDVPLAEAISFGRRLEAFHDLFTALLADILGENLPLVRRFRDPKMTGEPEYKPHIVYYFASKDEYVDYFRNKPEGPDLVRSLGYYNPPRTGGRRAPAYFFRDPNGQLPVTANLYHEVSHQLLFETAGPNAYTRNVGNYWVFEGLGTYFETVSPQPDGSLEVGGLVGRRMEEAIHALVDQGRVVPLAKFVALDKNDFERDDPRIYLYYQQAMALTAFLMQWHSGAYRDAFLDYVHDAYRGRIKQRTGRKLDDRLGQPYGTLEAQFIGFLKSGQVRTAGGGPLEKSREGTGIRTVPRPE
jgi:hypothetical protein